MKIRPIGHKTEKHHPEGKRTITHSPYKKEATMMDKILGKRGTPKETKNKQTPARAHAFSLLDSHIS